MRSEELPTLQEINKEREEKLGFTTGSAAAAAARAAALMLKEKEKISRVELATPAGIKLRLEVVDAWLGSGEASAAVIKNAGDDPDITDGIRIEAHLQEKADIEGVRIEAGEGVGTVTEPGLAVEEGRPAVNPVPRRMITEEVKKILLSEERDGKADWGYAVTISVPEGEEVAGNTFNPRLGIEGGISILGTTGIVEPMSDKAYKDSLALKVSQSVASGRRRLVLVFGNYGRSEAEKLGFAGERVVRMSNYVGFMLEKCCENGVEDILLLGHLGKLIKVAAGIFNTHSSIADARLETLAAYTAAQGGSQDLVREILTSSTSEGAAEIIREAEKEEVFSVLAEKIVERVEERCDCEMKTAAALFSMECGILAAAGNSELLSAEKGLKEYVR